MKEDAFTVAPYTPSEVRFHLAGGMLNGAVVLAGLVWLVSNDMPGWPWILLAVFAGMYTADLVSGLLHWAFDTWFDEEITFLRRMVLQVREHHVYPNRIFHISFLHDAGTLSWIALILIGPVVLGAIVHGGPVAACAVLSAVIFDVMLVTMLEFHKCGHRARQPRASRIGSACYRRPASCYRRVTTVSITRATTISTTASSTAGPTGPWAVSVSSAVWNGSSPG